MAGCCKLCRKTVPDGVEYCFSCKDLLKDRHKNRPADEWTPGYSEKPVKKYDPFAFASFICAVVSYMIFSVLINPDDAARPYVNVWVIIFIAAGVVLGLIGIIRIWVSDNLKGEWMVFIGAYLCPVSWIVSGANMFYMQLFGFVLFVLITASQSRRPPHLID